MASVLRVQALLAPSVRACPQRAFSAVKPSFAPVCRPTVGRGALVVMAAEDAKKAPKKMDSAVKRAMVAEDRRMYNKGRKSACATRIKKVLKEAEKFMASPPKAEDEIKQLEKLIAEAYTEIDKAVVKGILHENTAARKKARCARHKKLVLMAAGLYTPAADSPDFARFQKLAAKTAVKA